MQQTRADGKTLLFTHCCFQKWYFTLSKKKQEGCCVLTYSLLAVYVFRKALNSLSVNNRCFFLDETSLTPVQETQK